MKRKNLYRIVIVLGVGKIACGVLKHIVALRDIYGYQVLYINNGKSVYDEGKAFAYDANVEYREIYDSKEMTKFFLSITVNALIVSAGNFYLFPKEVIQMQNLVIINFHNSILPDYAGRNAPSWVIFNGEKETGITWHYVSTGIDDGAIICREYCEVGREEKAYHLAGRLMKLGIIGFERCFRNILDDTVQSIPQNRYDVQKIYYAKDIPGGGQCSSNDTTDDIYRLLRSMDYGKADIFPAIVLLWENKPLKILRYKKIEIFSMDETDTLCLPFSDGTYLQIKYKE